jgi:cyclase
LAKGWLVPAARIIPCLDVADGRVVKGVRFRDHRDVGDSVALALRYRDEGADELVFYDILASADGRAVDPEWVARIAAVLDIPFAVAGGIRDVATARAVLDAGADKISINSPALERPALLSELADAFGRQCVVLGIDSYRGTDGSLRVRQYSGRPEAMQEAGRETLAWAREAAALGAGEIVLNCMNNDGVRAGYDLDQLAALVAAVDVPVIASGGAGKPEHFTAAFRAGASGALAATVFHDRLIAIPALKDALASQGIEVRR